MASAAVRSKVVVLPLFIPALFVVAPIVCRGLVLGACLCRFYAFISKGKRELFALLLFCSECHVAVVT